MKNKIKRVSCMVLALMLLTGIFSQAPAEAKTTVTCKKLCGSALKATGGSKKLKYTSASAMDFGALSSSARKKVISIQYVCDAKEVYSLCVIETKKASHAKSLLKALNKYKKGNCKSDYLSDYSSTERKVFRNAVCGKKGKYVWYIAMSPKKKVNSRGQTALKKRLSRG